MMWSRLNIYSMVSVALLFVTQSAYAETGQRHALLIGVTEYPDSIDELVPSLSGPRNDVALVHRTLRDTWGEDADITVLADTLERSAYQWDGDVANAPTRPSVPISVRQLTG